MGVISQNKSADMDAISVITLLLLSNCGNKYFSFIFCM